MYFIHHFYTQKHLFYKLYAILHILDDYLFTLSFFFYIFNTFNNFFFGFDILHTLTMDYITAHITYVCSFLSVSITFCCSLGYKL